MSFTTNHYEELSKNLINKIIDTAEPFQFNLKNLPDVYEYTYNRSIRDHEVFREFFTFLDSKVNSCLYWFELDEEIGSENVLKLLNDTRPILLEQEDRRVVPVQNGNLKSKYLYVGIRRGGFTKKWKLSNISGRIVQHFGYYRKGSTQGLQLAHWATDLDLNLTVNVVEFETGFPNEYLETLEKLLAHKFKPLCGRH